MEELIELLENDVGLSAAEIGEKLTKILDDYKSKDILLKYLYDNKICTNCFSIEFREKKTLEDTDLDGNRGRWYAWLICENCGTEI